MKRKGVLKRGPGGHLTLKLDAYKKIVGDLAQGGISIGLLEFQGHGEPLVNPKLWEMIRFGRAVSPISEIRVVTHSNFVFRQEMRDSGISEIIFSIDGIDQDSYEKYRIGGDYATAFKFMRDFRASSWREGDVRTIWKYVLFDHNSSSEQLEALAREAINIGVKEVLLVITQMGPSSVRFFQTLLAAWDLCGNDQRARAILSKFGRTVDVAETSAALIDLLGESPFPEIMTSVCEDRPKFRVICYTSLVQNLDANLGPS